MDAFDHERARDRSLRGAVLGWADVDHERTGFDLGGQVLWRDAVELCLGIGEHLLDGASLVTHSRARASVRLA